MTIYIGIDLGTTNSAIATFDGTTVRLHKSPEQHDVTPSAISFDRRGNKYVGFRAYKKAAQDPGSAAVLFKRLMGTSTVIQLPSVDRSFTPEECSTELLKVLHGYLPEEARESSQSGTVITVPAAFNQMQKDATRAAAEAAGIPNIAIMQEPVAAVMSVMRTRRSDGVFLIYDFGGGTLDIAIAQSFGGRVELLGHGGIAMCGGRDFDRALFDGVVKPWLFQNFDLPQDLAAHDRYRGLHRMATWAAEIAKIELSSREETAIALTEDEISTRDLSGTDLYLQIPLNRQILDEIIADRARESVRAARETLKHAGLSAQDVECVVFVGGPTQYKPLRDLVTSELGIAPSTEVNPMTAVAEGAAVFAESIDWGSQRRSIKPSVGGIQSGGAVPLLIKFHARTPASLTRISVRLDGVSNPGCEMQVDSTDSGWSSGRFVLDSRPQLELPLNQLGENAFTIALFDAKGRSVPLVTNRIVITRTAAVIDAIPASSSIGVEVLEKLGGRPTLEYLVRKGDSLPRKGTTSFRAAEALAAGASGSINFKLWEGEIEDRIVDNRLIGMFSIAGRDFDEGVIAAGVELICDFEVLDSGNIVLEVRVPTIAGSFRNRDNFYSRQAGGIDFTKAAGRVREEAAQLRERLEQIASRIEDPELLRAGEKLDRATKLDANESDPELTKEAQDGVLEAKAVLAAVRRHHAHRIREMDLERVVDTFTRFVREHARPTEITAFEALVHTARLQIEGDGAEFETHLDDLRSRNFQILNRLDEYIVTQFGWQIEDPSAYVDARLFQALVNEGNDAIEKGDFDRLRKVVSGLFANRIVVPDDEDLMAAANIVRG